MSKYVRTKDGRIIETEDFIAIKEYNKFMTEGTIYKYDSEEVEIVKQADTIEELCDFIIYDNDIFWNKIYTFSNNSKEIQNSSRRIDINQESIKKGIYYAIWTKGENKEPILKSVAKLNENGELELL